MADGDEERNSERIDRLVSGVIDGRHLNANPSDAAEHETIMMAARLAGSREGYPRMSPAFRRRLAEAFAELFVRAVEADAGLELERV